MRLAKELKVFNCLLPVQVLNLLTAFAGQSIHHDALLDLSSQLLCELNSIRVNGHAVDTALNEELAELRIYARSLTADRNGLAILMSNLNQVTDCTAYSQVTFVIDMRTVSLSRSQPRTSIVRSLEPME